MKILILTSKLPYPATGADEQDRFEGLRLLKELGHELRVIAKVAAYQKEEDVETLSRAITSKVETLPYRGSGFSMRRLFDIGFWDGAAYEYADPGTVRALTRAIGEFKPDCVWLDGSFMWPLISVAHSAGLPVVVRSLQIESTHIIADEGASPINLLRAYVKGVGEARMARTADVVIAINRNEAVRYEEMGAKHLETVPLRQLPSLLEKGGIEYRDARPLHVLFTASTFSVTHNRIGAENVIRKIAPELDARAPGEFMIHITGAKLPDKIRSDMPANVTYEGYVPDFDAFMRSIDIAITQSLGNAGMHGKLFAPVAAGIPTVTQSHALAGFSFAEGEGMVFGESPESVVAHLLSLREKGAREKIGKAGLKQAEHLFSRTALKMAITRALDAL